MQVIILGGGGGGYFPTLAIYRSGKCQVPEGLLFVPFWSEKGCRF